MTTPAVLFPQLPAVRAAIAAKVPPWTAAAAQLMAASAARAGKVLPAVPTALVLHGYYQDPAGNQAVVQPIIAQCDAAFVCALYGAISGQPAPTAVRLMDAWALGNRTISHVTDPRYGNDAPLFLCTEMVGLLLAALILGPAVNVTQVRGWLETTCIPTVIYICDGLKMRNNWQSHALHFYALAALYLGNAAMLLDVAKRLALHIDTSIDVQTGRLPLEDARGDRSVNYTYFSLLPILSAVTVLNQAAGEDAFAPQQPVLRLALDTLLARLSPLEPGQASSLPFGPELYELAGALYGSAAYKAYAIPHRPILPLGQHLSIATAATLTAVVAPTLAPAPPPPPARRKANRRKTDVAPVVA